MTEANDFDADIDKMTKIADVVKKFENADVQALAYATLSSRAFGTPLPRREPVVQSADPAGIDDATVDLDEETDESGVPAAKKAAAKKAPAKRSARKLSFDVPKNADFAPSGVQSLKDFAAEKAPSSNPEKALVVSYWLQEIAGRTVTTGEVIAAFTWLGWPAPKHPDNNLQQAGVKHWLDTKNMNDIEVVWQGKRHIQDELPKAAKK